MAEIITRQDLQASAVNQATGSASEGMKGLTDNMQGINQFANTVLQLVEKVMQMRGVQNNGKQLEEFKGMQGSPTQISENKNQQTQTKVIRMELDGQKVKNMIGEAIISMGALMPDNVKEIKLGDVVGENFKTFKYEHNGMEITADQILNAITLQIVNKAPQLQKEKV